MRRHAEEREETYEEIRAHWLATHLVRALEDRGLQITRALAERCVEAAERDTPPCDYSVRDRPDVLDCERDAEVERRTLALALAAVGTR
jgi:hypothetical protein